MAETRPALVVGSARGVWDDLSAARPSLVRPVIFAVNLMVALLPQAGYRVDHAVSHHGAELPPLADYAARVARSQESDAGRPVVHSTRAAAGVDRVWPTDWKVGDSGLLAVRVALALGHARVVLAGVPLAEDGAHVYDPPGAKPFNVSHHRPCWEGLRDEFAGRVISMSGFTRDLLGTLA